MKKWIKNKLLWLGWWIMDDYIRTRTIHRAYFNDYTQWMSRDFPIMQDMHEHFLDKPYGGNHNMSRIRQEMEEKYIKKDPLKGWDDARAAMFKASKK